MSKLKKFIPGIFGNNKDNKNFSNNKVGSEDSGQKSKPDQGRLETDALPVDDEQSSSSSHTTNNNNNITPTVSTELTESVVSELSHTNYNQVEEATAMANGNAFMDDNADASGAIALPLHNNNSLTTPIADGTLAINNTAATTMNTMNVHNAQQQMVMQFSNINKLHFGSVYNINTNVSATAGKRKNSKSEEPNTGSSVSAVENTLKRQSPRKTTTIVAMMQSSEEPSHRLLECISTHLGEGWKHVMRALGHSEGQIEQALIDHQIHGGIKEVIYQLLLQWIRDADDGVATLGHITTLLWETNHRDCVQRLKLVYKSNIDGGKKSS